MYANRGIKTIKPREKVDASQQLESRGWQRIRSDYGVSAFWFGTGCLREGGSRGYGVMVIRT